jgi:hypothetical protein
MVGETGDGRHGKQHFRGELEERLREAEFWRRRGDNFWRRRGDNFWMSLFHVHTKQIDYLHAKFMSPTHRNRPSLSRLVHFAAHDSRATIQFRTHLEAIDAHVIAFAESGGGA